MTAAPMMPELRAATWEWHQRLEKRLDVKRRFADRDAYRGHLLGMWGFCAGLEARWGPEPFGAALPDYASRRKTPLLARDLAALGADPSRPPQPPVCAALPACADVAASFGCLYVLEGASLGGRMLLPLAQQTLGLTAMHGAAFLASYGASVDSMWRTFGDAVNAWCQDPQRRSSAARGAMDAFRSLEQWLCDTPTPA